MSDEVIVFWKWDVCRVNELIYRPLIQYFANFYICSYSDNTDWHRFNTDVARSQSFGLLFLALASLLETVSLLSQPLGGLQLASQRSQNYPLRIILYFVKSGRRGVRRSPPSVCESKPEGGESRRLKP